MSGYTGHILLAAPYAYNYGVTNTSMYLGQDYVMLLGDTTERVLLITVVYENLKEKVLKAYGKDSELALIKA